MIKLIYVLIMVVVIISTDLLFFRSHVWTLARLIVNIGIVLVGGAFYLRFFK